MRVSYRRKIVPSAPFVSRFWQLPAELREDILPHLNDVCIYMLEVLDVLEKFNQGSPPFYPTTAAIAQELNRGKGVVAAMLGALELAGAIVRTKSPQKTGWMIKPAYLRSRIELQPFLRQDSKIELDESKEYISPRTLFGLPSNTISV